MCEFVSLSMRLCERCVVSMRFYAFRMVCTWRRPTDDEWTSMPNKFSDSNAPFQHHQAFDKNHHTFVPHNSHMYNRTFTFSRFLYISIYFEKLVVWPVFFSVVIIRRFLFLSRFFFLASSSTLLERRFYINIDMTERPQHRTLKCKWC